MSATILASLLLSVTANTEVSAAPLEPQNVAEVVVTAAKGKAAALTESASATGLDLSLRETPQSVTVIDRQRIDDFALTNVNDVLDQAVGVTVQRNETDRTDYTSRGFQITNFQVDGIGLPLGSGIQFGDLDTLLFERVDVVRGANAIETGVGNPSATINYLRKRPTDDFLANASLQGGSFGAGRVDADVSGPLNASGTIRGRVMAAYDSRDSYLDYDRQKRDVEAGLIAFDLTPKLTATLGYSRQDNRASGVLWGALPLVYSDGTRIPYPRSASTSAPWTHWNNRDQTAFGELAYRLGGDWSARAVFTYRDLASNARILYASGAPDPDTGLGVTGQSGLYPTQYRQYLLDGYASGSVRLFGRRHEVAFGVSSGWASDTEYEGFSDETIDYGDIRRLADFHAPEPTYPVPVLQARVRDDLVHAYGAIRLNPTDRLHGVFGVTAVWLKTRGTSYGTDEGRDDNAASPYAGLLYDLTPHLTLYASYTDIFSPQSEVDVTNRRLDPAKGDNVEGGLKGSWLDGRLYAAATVFRARQTGIATYAGTFGDNGNDNGPIGGSFYVGQKVTSEGVELEVSGRIAQRWLLSGGYTHLRIRDADDVPARTFAPRDSVKFAATYTVKELHDLKMGAAVRYQSETSGTDDTAGLPIHQGAYTVLDLLGGVRLAPHFTADLNVRNVTDAKYIGSLEWGQGFYAAPRSVLVTLRYEY